MVFTRPKQLALMLRARKTGFVWWCGFLGCSLTAMSLYAETETSATPVTEAADTQAAASTEPKFTIAEYQIEGNSVLSVIAVEKVVIPWLGEGKTIADVEQARKSLQKAYQDAGYSTVFVDIPEQDVVNGVVRLRVMEGRVGRLNVIGSRYYSLGRIRSQVPALAPGSVPHLPDVQKQMSAVNRAAADRQVTPVFRAGRTPGTVDVELKVRDHPPLHASLELNNRYSSNTSHTRVIGQLRYDNLWQREHSLSVQYQTAPEKTDEVRVYSLSYLFRSDNAKDLTVFYAVRSRSDVAVIGDISVIGSGDIYGVRRIIPLPPGKQYFHTLSLGADFKSFDENIMLQGADSVQTPIRYLPFSIAYNANLPGESGTSQFSTSINFSVRSLMDKQVDCLGQVVDQFECKRFGAHSNYLYLKADFQRTQKLPFDMSLAAKISGQVAGQPLISNEQFSAGGAESVRGYLESERFGDDGLQGSLEWRSRSFAGEKTPGLQKLLFLIFADAANLRIKDPLPDQRAHFSLVGTGLGLRFTARKNIKGELDWAQALKDGAGTKTGGKRLHFRLESSF